MISYYKSKHPGLFIYISLVCISVSAFLFLDINAKYLGILSILWGSFILMRTLSLYEVEEHAEPLTSNIGSSKSGNKNSSALAHDLLKTMKNKTHLKRGIWAMSSLNIRTIIWFIIAITYLCYRIITQYNYISVNILTQDIAGFFIIGAAFWIAQTYAYSNQASKLMLTAFGLLLCITILKTNTNLNVNTEILFEYSHIIKNWGSVILAILAIYSAAIFIYPIIKRSSNTLGSFIGLIIITLLTICSLNLEATLQNTPIWLLGWSIISIFWVRSYSQSRIKYTLYQCE